MKSVFNREDVSEIIGRINSLRPESQRLWGKMAVDQMLAHLNVVYEMTYTNKHPKPNLLMGFILKTLVKRQVVSKAPYKKNLRTAPQFIISDKKDFVKEKHRLIEFIEKTLELGEAHFEGKESHSFGELIKTEWNNMFYKHLDHHLTQFGV